MGHPPVEAVHDMSHYFVDLKSKYDKVHFREPCLDRKTCPLEDATIWVWNLVHHSKSYKRECIGRISCTSFIGRLLVHKVWLPTSRYNGHKILWDPRFRWRAWTWITLATRIQWCLKLHWTWHWSCYSLSEWWFHPFYSKIMFLLYEQYDRIWGLHPWYWSCNRPLHQKYGSIQRFFFGNLLNKRRVGNPGLQVDPIPLLC